MPKTIADPVEHALERLSACALHTGEVDAAPLAFPHIPKTGGVTLRNHFARHMELHEDYFHLGPWGRNQAAEAGIDLEQRLLERRDEIQVLFGHYVSLSVLDNLSLRSSLAIVLREPAEQVASFYNFRMHLDPWEPFEAFYAKSQYQDCMTRWIAANFLGLPVKSMDMNTVFDAVCEALKAFSHVCITEALAECTASLMEECSIPALSPWQRDNVAGRNFDKCFTLTPEWRARIAEGSARDYALYEFYNTLELLREDKEST